MLFTFEGQIIHEGNRCFIKIPFHVWEATGLKGSIPVKVSASHHTFECKLLPKGNGNYWIPVKKELSAKLSGAFEVSFEVIASLSRINHDSPYSKEKPIRKIDSINEIEVIPGFCGHSCVAMLAGISVDEVVKLMGKKAPSWSKIMEALDYYGIPYAEKMVYPKGKPFRMPRCCIAYIDGGFALWYQGKYYGSTIAEGAEIVGYLEIESA